MAIGRRRNIRFFFHNPIGIVGAPGILSPSLSIYTDLYSPLSVCVCVCNNKRLKDIGVEEDVELAALKLLSVYQ